MLMLVDKARAPITANHRISLDSDIGEFWTIFSRNMTEEKVAAVNRIASLLADDHGAITPGCLFQIHHHTLSEYITANGGKPGWIKSIEYLFAQEFPRVEGNAPPSAALAMSGAGPAPLQISRAFVNRKRTVEETDGADRPSKRAKKYSAVLKEQGQFEAVLSFNKSDIDAMVIETKKPVRTRLRMNDQKSITEHAFKLLSREGDVGCDKDIFDYWDEQLTTFGYPLPCHGSWPEAFKNRFKNGRKGSAQVRACM